MDQKNNAIASEMERLRDLLYGDFARQAQDKIDDIEKNLTEFQSDTVEFINKHHKAHLDKLENSINAQLQAISDDIMAEIKLIKQRLDRIESEFATKESLGNLFIEFGHQLKDAIGEKQ